MLARLFAFFILVFPAAAFEAQPTQTTISLTFIIPGQSPIAKSAPWFPGITVEKAMQQAGIKYVTGWWPDLGNALLIAEGTPSSTNGKLGSPFWWLCIDGKSSDKGMTSAKIPSATSKVEWFWTTEGACKAQ